MRTTLTIDPDVARLLDDELQRSHRPMKQIVNNGLRAALGPAPRPHLPPYEVTPHRTALRPGVDGAPLNTLADEIEDEEVLAPRVNPARR